ncbi:MAG: nucleotidyltransferase family protein [Hyphomicrobiaceae bacterium]|nr:nucleotidyltransferase family protein [Hyphomicrobiaceae bacterium]
MQAGEENRSASRAAVRVAAVVLAAGRSTRMGAQNKLLAEIGGKPMVRCVAESALGSKARPVLVVTGHHAGDVAAALSGLGVILVANPDYATGLASSLKAGIRALPAECEGALVLLGDMPRITSEHLGTLVDAFAAARDAIVVPVHEGRQGNPVLWPRRYFPELLQLEGDAGAKRLIATHWKRVLELDFGSEAPLVDVDTPEALRNVRGVANKRQWW